MPRQNRVTPYGELEAVADRGMFWGSRGPLLDTGGRLARYSRGRLWLICVLKFKGRRRVQWQPGRLTELYFLDEATGLAAGHRPCGECRYHDYRAFKQAWAAACLRERGEPGKPRVPGKPGKLGKKVSAAAIDARLHADRLAAPGKRRTYQAPLAGLPDGTMIDLDGRPWLVRGPGLLAWSHGGHGERRERPRGTRVTVLTPAVTVAVLAAGYQPVLHPTALPPAARRGDPQTRIGA